MLIKSLRTRYWAAALGFLLIIYSTLYIVRPVCTFLKETTPFPVLINVLCAALLTGLILFFAVRQPIRKVSSYIVLAAVICGYIYGMIILQHPEEKVHFIEYGFLSYLVFRAIALDIRKPVAYLYTFILVFLFGWIDEGIQHLLPNRYYQTEDVILNGASGALGLFLVFIYQRERHE